jgi:hypothetical protein
MVAVGAAGGSATDRPWRSRYTTARIAANKISTTKVAITTTKIQP